LKILLHRLKKRGKLNRKGEIGGVIGN